MRIKGSSTAWIIAGVTWLATTTTAQADSGESIGDRAGQYQRMADWLRRPDESLRVASDLAGMLQTAMYDGLGPLWYLAAFAGLATALVGMMYAPRDFNPAKVGIFFLIAMVATYPVPFPRDEPSPVTTELMAVDADLETEIGQRTGALGFVVIDTLFTTGHLYIIELVSAITGGRVGEERFGTHAISTMATMTSTDLSAHLGAAPELIHMINDYDSYCGKVGQFSPGDPGWGSHTPLDDTEMIAVGLSGDLSGWAGDPESVLSGGAIDTMRQATFSHYNIQPAELVSYTVPSMGFWLDEFRDDTGRIEALAERYPHRYAEPADSFAGVPGATTYPLREGVPSRYHWTPSNCWELHTTLRTALENYWRASEAVYSRSPEEIAEREYRQDAPVGCAGGARGGSGCSRDDKLGLMSAEAAQTRMITMARDALDETDMPPGSHAGVDGAIEVVTVVGEKVRSLVNRVTLAFSIPIAISIAAAAYLLAGLLFPLICALAILPTQHSKFWITVQLMAFIHITMLLSYLVLEVGGWAWYLLISIGSQSPDYAEHMASNYAILGFGMELAIYIGVASSVYLAFLLVTSNVYGAVMGMSKIASQSGPSGVAQGAATVAKGAASAPSTALKGARAVQGAKGAMSGMAGGGSRAPAASATGGGTVNKVRQMQANMRQGRDDK